MKLGYRLILIVSALFIIGVIFWALFAPKEEITEKIYKTLKEQETKADLSFKLVVLEEISNGVKYWELNAKTAVMNKSTNLATLKEVNGTFFKKGKAVLRFKSPAALWDMQKKEIYLDQPLGYDALLERKISSLIKTLTKPNLSLFNLPETYKKLGYWFQAKNLSWKLTDQKLVCTGGIELNKGEVTGKADKLEGDVAMEKIIISGNPKISIAPDHQVPATVEADRFTIISAEDLILAQGNPIIRWENAVITAADIKYLQNEKVLKLSEKVKINYRDIQAWGDNATYYTESQKIILEGNAYARQTGNELKGEKVIVSLKDKKISVKGRGKFVITEEELKE